MALPYQRIFLSTLAILALLATVHPSAHAGSGFSEALARLRASRRGEIPSPSSTGTSPAVTGVSRNAPSPGTGSGTDSGTGSGAATPAVPAEVANRLLFANGDRVQGKLLNVRGGKISFSAFETAAIQAALTSLVDARTEESHEVSLDNGTIVVGAFRENGQPGSLRLATDVGELDLETTRITGVEDVGHNAAVIAAKEQAAEVHLGKVWGGYLDVGFSEATGNTEIRDLKATVQAVRRTEVDKLQIHLLTHSSSAAKTKTAQRSSGDVRMDLFLPRNFFYFFHGNLETDELRSLDLRTTLGAGFGKTWHGPHNFELGLGVGYSFVREAFGNGTDNSEGTLLLTLDFEHDLGPRVSFSNRTVANEHISEHELRLTSTSTFKSKITDKLSFTLSFLQKLDTDPPPGIKDSDFTTLVGLRRDF